MRLICAFVSRILGSRVASEPMPHWVARHISGCDKCRDEAEQYRRLSQVIKQSAAGDETLGLNWQDLRATLPKRGIRHARNAVIPAFAAAAVVLISVCIGLSLQGGRKTSELVVEHSPDLKSSTVVHEPQRAADSVVAKQPIAKQPNPAVRSTAPRTKSPRVKPYEAPRPRLRLPRSDDPTRHVATNPDPPELPYAVVGAEEHVINVVGVGSEDASADSDTDYVIRTTETSDDDHLVVML